jgi:hypothetical protein
MNGDRIGRQLSLATRRELIEAIGSRYQSGTRIEKKKILDEFVEVTGFHRKHAIRALRKAKVGAIKKASRAWLYNDAWRVQLQQLRSETSMKSHACT